MCGGARAENSAAQRVLRGLRQWRLRPAPRWAVRQDNSDSRQAADSGLLLPYRQIPTLHERKVAAISSVTTLTAGTGPFRGSAEPWTGEVRARRRYAAWRHACGDPAGTWGLLVRATGGCQRHPATAPATARMSSTPSPAS
jgi:hypothetical protein